MKKLTNLMAVIAIIVSSSIFTSCKKASAEIDETPADFNSTKTAVQKANDTKTELPAKYENYLDQNMTNVNAGQNKCNIPAPVQWGQGGEITAWLQSSLTINANSYYSYFPQPMVNIPALGKFQVKYCKNGVWKVAKTTKVIWPGSDLYDFGSMTITGLTIDYGTQFYMESWGLSICLNTSHIAETFGPYYAGNTAITEKWIGTHAVDGSLLDKQGKQINMQ
jgi:hypothetical protein